ncbi:Ferredoxin subunit of nitrite reductase and ring-hydroxylating dioxygenase [Paraburkholderia caribensis MBA4]|uniref:Ferredoxin subunit of nitrite reductase and ring-hydroxylating dioxygenase n=1 Tax=Paraburkholderia caribensis MBA4 TaxID=1323664 RepID=A0A0P0RIH7_9BURK|nr:non-heme iron oxygenase ferredoxin subunit [Paraburkholderia caribensis]ALL68476.1 Ferredoxin subunit of nitrite reductase and ring-hydroxylating dioxygenase [Paraburkholderia caribensis MBA4]
MTWQEVAKKSDVEDGEAVQVCVAGEPVAIYNVSGTFYATHDICTHALAHLSEGYIDGDCVECPLHGGVFRITTGEAVSGPVQKPLRVYPIKVEGESIFIDG